MYVFIFHSLETRFLTSSQVKEDIDALIHTLTPILYITKTGVPKPPFLDPNVIQHLTNKVCQLFSLRYNYDIICLLQPGTLNLLHRFGWLPNNRGDYVFVDAISPEEINQREEIANEFRQFCNELKKIKDNDISSVENSHAVNFRNNKAIIVFFVVDHNYNTILIISYCTG